MLCCLVLYEVMFLVDSSIMCSLSSDHEMVCFLYSVRSSIFAVSKVVFFSVSKMYILKGSAIIFNIADSPFGDMVRFISFVSNFIISIGLELKFQIGKFIL